MGFNPYPANVEHMVANFRKFYPYPANVENMVST